MTALDSVRIVEMSFYGNDLEQIVHLDGGLQDSDYYSSEAISHLFIDDGYDNQALVYFERDDFDGEDYGLWRVSVRQYDLNAPIPNSWNVRIRSDRSLALSSPVLMMDLPETAMIAPVFNSNFVD